MTERVIFLVDQRTAALTAPRPELPIVATGSLRDTLGRPLHDLRISVTDRCNFRCSYCMPKEVFGSNHPYLANSALLSFEEITRLTRLFVAHGVRKVRLTGGEPLLRKNLEVLVAQLAALRTLDGKPLDLTLTTNGSLLARKAAALKAAGLNRVTVSLDALDDVTFRQMNDVDFPVAEVLEGIAVAQDVGLGPIKINMVIKRGVNDQEILPMAERFQGSGIALRFIEYMDVGATNRWRMDEVLPSAEVIQRIGQKWPLVPLQNSDSGETAKRWAYAGADGRPDKNLGEIGVISSVTNAFCQDCSRVRLSTEGRLYLCLFADQGYDFRALLREQSSDAKIASTIGAIWQNRSDRYSELRASLPTDVSAKKNRIEMSYIGG